MRSAAVSALSCAVGIIAVPAAEPLEPSSLEDNLHSYQALPVSGGPALCRLVVRVLVARRRAHACVGGPARKLTIALLHYCKPVDDNDGSSNTDYAAVAASLNSLLAKSAPSNAISGRDLRDLVRQKWGRSYDVRLAKLQGRMYLQGEGGPGGASELARRGVPGLACVGANRVWAHGAANAETHFGVAVLCTGV